MDRVLRSLESQRVLKCIHGSGIYVSPQIKQRKIGLVFPGNVHDPMRFSQFWGLLHTAALRIASQNGDELRTYFGCPIGNDEVLEPSAYSLPDDLDARRLGGFIVAAGSQKAMAWLKSSGLPIVALGENPLAAATVTFDPHANIHAGIRALAQAGSKRPAMIWFDPSTSTPSREDDPLVQEFRQACETAGVEFQIDFAWSMFDVPPHQSWTSLEELGGVIIRNKWAGTGEKPDGILFLDDTMAHGGLIALMQAGVKLDQDIKVASLTHAGASLLRPFWPSLIRLEIDPHEIMDKLFSLLGNLMQGVNNQDHNLMVEVKVIHPK
jgi:DNA-binding LacI/PurR family transcriptional regulator